MSATSILTVDKAMVADHHSLIFQAWRCIIGDARVIYLSGPITTGPRWLAAVNNEQMEFNGLINSNCQDLLDAAAKVRSDTSSIVIEPASLSVRGWSQDDYLSLWTELIERHAGEVRFLPGWEFSNGCAREFERAWRHAVPTRELDGTQIGLAEGLRQLRASRDKIAAQLSQSPRLHGLHSALAGVISRLESVA